MHETMLFSAHLRLPPKRPLAEKEAVVDAILGDLGMRECAHVRVEAVSGGQRRRVSVGLELIVNPSVLILDVRVLPLGMDGCGWVGWGGGMWHDSDDDDDAQRGVSPPSNAQSPLNTR